MKAIHPPRHAKPKGHYSPAIVHNGFVFVSGQLSMDDEGNPLSGTIDEQTRQSLERIKTILQAAGSDISKILKVNIFVADIADWPKVNETFAKFFGEHRPARIVVPSGELNYGCLVEIDCIAAVS